jgi:hypothetical protein
MRVCFFLYVQTESESTNFLFSLAVTSDVFFILCLTLGWSGALLIQVQNVPLQMSAQTLVNLTAGFRGFSFTSVSQITS